jgi:putative membrane protein
MLANIAIQTVINGIALWVAAWAVPGITFGTGQTTSSTILTVVIVALIFGLINALVRPIAALLSLPLIILTLGLFIFILNAAMLQLTSWIAGQFDLAFPVDAFFWDAIWGSLIITFVSLVLGLFKRAD